MNASVSLGGRRFAARVGRIQPSGIRAVLDEADRLAAAGETVINFAIGRPDFDTPAARRAACRARRDALCAALDGVPGLRLAWPQGTFYSFPAVTGDGAALALRLLREARIAAVPGGVFGADFAQHLRMSDCAALEDVADGARRAAGVLAHAAAAG